jgi:undecaprenyl diphosphate synthase
MGVEIVSVYAWSTENWDRPLSEVRQLMNFIRTLGPKFAKELHAKKVRIIHSGGREKLSKTLLRVIDSAVELTQENGPKTLNFAFNYGGRAEVVHVVKELLAQKVPPEKITEGMIASHLYTSGLPDVDLVIRTGGDQRMSNFLLWQSAYADIYVAESYWPSLSQGDIERAIAYYNRRFGRQA